MSIKLNVPCFEILILLRTIFLNKNRTVTGTKRTSSRTILFHNISYFNYVVNCWLCYVIPFSINLFRETLSHVCIWTYFHHNLSQIRCAEWYLSQCWILNNIFEPIIKHIIFIWKYHWDLKSYKNVLRDS